MSGWDDTDHGMSKESEAAARLCDALVATRCLGGGALPCARCFAAPVCAGGRSFMRSCAPPVWNASVGEGAMVPPLSTAKRADTPARWLSARFLPVRDAWPLRAHASRWRLPLGRWHRDGGLRTAVSRPNTHLAPRRPRLRAHRAAKPSTHLAPRRRAPSRPLRGPARTSPALGANSRSPRSQAQHAPHPARPDMHLTPRQPSLRARRAARAATGPIRTSPRAGSANALAAQRSPDLRSAISYPPGMMSPDLEDP